ncbi:head-tail adaptor protein [Streptomyces scabiei]|uniref:phage head completion protein n=1 Tax=Streptomyces scabiei TaxID=1930 RepID=UPI001B339287|nr:MULTISPECIES: head-tail adaptor protein [Streptomyces]MBP5915864.1 head-tail adaptor protein [Streptomyces sp. LBUM 1486]MDX2626481.1 head-tail adaptor protein [Streptomyces scabiei]MDX3028595.1 head-tail adaptor protein [Streptomyces scabiei]MDX3168288.1 head-tail adaptor protein [Streptomyces scabiei]MDX3207335.1 head-tail adaptor protein [Streptomyces scabiei]
MRPVGRLLNRAVEVWRKTAVDDGGGGQQTTWAHLSTPRARKSQPAARERTAADQAGAELNETWYFLPSADVQRGDELRPPDRVLKVIAVFEPSEDDVYRRADCTLVQPLNGTT